MTRAAFPSGRKSLLLLALAIIIVYAWWRQRPPLEPVSALDGQRISEWLAQKQKSGLSPLIYRQLDAFGPAAFPWLNYTVEYGKHPVRKHGPQPFDAAPDWLRRLLPASWGGLRGLQTIDERRAAVEMLDYLGPRAWPAIPALVRNLENQDDDLSGRAAVVLHRIGPFSWPAIQDVLDCGSPRARIILLSTMPERWGQGGKGGTEIEVAAAVAALGKALCDPLSKVRIATANSIKDCNFRRKNDGSYKATILPLIGLLSERDLDVSIPAIQAIGTFEAKAAPAIPRLIELLDDDRPVMRRNAAIYLSSIDKSKRSSAVRLRAMLRDPDSQCRAVASIALRTFGLPYEEGSAEVEALPTR